MGRFLPPKHEAGDANTVGGYRAVHERPAAFEGRDGSPYSVEIVTDEVGDPAGRYGAYLLFVRWAYNSGVAAGHLETPYIEFADDERVAAAALGAMRLSDARRLLDELITRDARPERPWYDVMRDS